jgi:glycosyltransferase involved in cell wall biosynthesis
MKKISIVIPVYFNERSLDQLFSSIKNISDKLKEENIEIEIIAIDDGSGDESLDKLLKIKEDFRNLEIIKLTRNYGAWPAVKAGLSQVNGDCFVILAADMQDSPALIYDMAKKWVSGHKFVICERLSRDDPLISKILSAIYYKLIKIFVLKDYPIGGYDLALMDRVMLSPLVNSSKSSYLPILAFSLGYKPEVIYYHRKKRVEGKSRWTLQKKIKVFLDVILGFSVTPIRAISGIGAIVAMMSFSYGALVVGYSLIYQSDTPGFAALASLITFLLGLIILMLGVIGEYLWRIFDESNKRPEFIVEKIYKRI